jgi:hypothetical protein
MHATCMQHPGFDFSGATFNGQVNDQTPPLGVVALGLLQKAHNHHAG